MLVVRSVNFYAGRLRPIRAVVLHTAQVPCRPGRAEGVQRYLAQGYVRASCHYATDPDNTVEGVAEADTAWATPSLNADGVQVEQAGYAEFGSGDAIDPANTAARQAYGSSWPSWDTAEPQRMLQTQVVPLVADLCRRHGLPAVQLGPSDLLAGRAGITDHWSATQAYGGDHWDCGHHYPLAGVVEDVRRALAGTPSPTPQEDTNVVRLIRDTGTGTVYWWDGQTRAPVGTWAGDDWPTIVARLRRLVALHPSASEWPAGTVGDKPALYVDLEPWDVSAIPLAG